MGRRRHVESFLEMLVAERGAALNTMDSYQGDIDDFSGFAAARGVDLEAASSADINAYLRDLAQRGFAASSQARRLSALRQFYRFLYAEGVRGDDPSSTVDSPKRQRPLPKIMSVEEVDTLIETAKEAAEKPGTRRGALAGAASLHIARSALRNGLARLGTCGATGRRRGAGASRHQCARQGRQGTACSAQRGRPCGDARLSRSAPRSWAPCRQSLAVCVFRCQRTPDKAGLCARPEGACRFGRNRPKARLAACAAPCFCQPFAAKRRRSARRAAAFGSRRYIDNTDLHPRFGRTPQASCQ